MMNREIVDFNNIFVNTAMNFVREYHNFIEDGEQDKEFYRKGSSIGPTVMSTTWRGHQQ
jgi:hypothetical protein